NRIAIIICYLEPLQVPEYFLAKVVHYLLAHRLQHHPLNVLNCKCSDVCQQEDQGYERDSLVGAPAKAQLDSQVPKEESKTAGRRGKSPKLLVALEGRGLKKGWMEAFVRGGPARPGGALETVRQKANGAYVL